MSERGNSSPGPGRGWIVSPLFDLLFLANLGWPILLIPGLALPDGTVHTDFWQLYFLTTPHRWITLFLVASDPDRRAGRGRLFLGFAVAAALVVGGTWLGTGSLTCLLLIDYVWNAWHYASQHQGVLRMYSRKSGGGREWLERHGLRLFVVYTVVRTAGWSTGWIEADSHSRRWMNGLDLTMLGIPTAILLSNVRGFSASRGPKGAYLLSLLGLYSGLLLSLRNDWRYGVFALTAASSLFHAVEYLAVVSHYTRRRVDLGSDGFFRKVAANWTLLLAAYLLALGLIGVWATQPTSGVTRAWIALNTWAAFLHYTYDGFIWKLRRPETARTLGVSA
jgi:hypothetical protein